MTQTIDHETLGYKINQKPEIAAEATFFFNRTLVFAPTLVQGGISDQELMRLPFQTGMFSFLDNPAEDIYTLEDGRALS